MAVLFMEGWDGRPPPTSVAEVIPAPTIPLAANATNGREGGGSARHNYERPAAHNRGLKVEVNTSSPDLWIGVWFKWPNTHAVPDSHTRIVVIYIDGSPALSFGFANSTSTSDRYAFIESPPDLDDVPAATPDHISESVDVPVTSGVHFIFHIERGETGGTATVYVEGEPLLVADDIAGLASGEGPVEHVLYNGRGTRTNTTNQQVDFDDLWIATENYGNARIVLMVPEADGHYADGTPSSGSDLFDMLDDVPPNDSTDVTLDVDERMSFVMDDSALAALAAMRLGAIQIEPRFEGPASVTAFARIDGTDYDLDGFTNPSTDRATGRIISEANPAATNLWGGSFDGIELGVRT